MKTWITKHIAVVAVVVMMTGVNCKAGTIQEAFELRLGGDVDAALVMLEQVLASEPENAAAWYEFARTKAHIGLGNPRSMMESMKENQVAAGFVYFTRPF